MTKINPFITNGYISAEYFCDRIVETEMLTRYITNGNNIALISNLEMGDIKTPTITLDEIFHYLEQADKPCLVSIDEFQVITRYPENNVEAILRTHIQHCANANHLCRLTTPHDGRNIYQSVAPLLSKYDYHGLAPY